jgi:hypothetical protein
MMHFGTQYQLVVIGVAVKDFEVFESPEQQFKVVAAFSRIIAVLGSCKFWQKPIRGILWYVKQTAA